MTVKTNRYIELSDVLGLKFDCRDCGATLTIPASRDMSKTEEWGKLNTCPVCRNPWATIGSSTYQPTIAEFTAKLRRLQETMATAPVGFTLTLEVNNEEAEA
jgi:hypothetical protein